ncbi:MAG: cytochrome C [Bacillota bacterium]|nr:cytochrome C [Bacillota bacterium]
MKNIAKLFVASAMAASLVACSSAQKQEEPVANVAVGVYDVYNKTGEKVTDLYVYIVDSEDKGDNYAGEGLANDAMVKIEYAAAADATLVLEFTTESGYNAKFETLHIEEAPISLLSQDAMTGATPIAFQAGE